MQIGNDITEESFKKFIEGISNDIVNWDNIKERFRKDNGVTYAKKRYQKIKHMKQNMMEQENGQQVQLYV